MTEEIEIQQTAQETASAVPSGENGDSGAENTTPRFNRYLYENLISNVECQIEFWNRKAGRESNFQAAQALRFKAEGLGYALRPLYAFEAEFRELTDSASHCAANGTA